MAPTPSVWQEVLVTRTGLTWPCHIPRAVVTLFPAHGTTRRSLKLLPTLGFGDSQCLQEGLAQHREAGKKLLPREAGKRKRQRMVCVGTEQEILYS